jgi:hypothetical protein
MRALAGLPLGILAAALPVGLRDVRRPGVLVAVAAEPELPGLQNANYYALLKGDWEPESAAVEWPRSWPATSQADGALGACGPARQRQQLSCGKPGLANPVGLGPAALSHSGAPRPELGPRE